MTRPEDIPQDVWDIARELLGEPDTVTRPKNIERAARALMTYGQRRADEAREKAAQAIDNGLRVVFDRLPDHDPPGFIEVEDADGRSVSVGEWRAREDGLVELVLPSPANLHARIVELESALDHASSFVADHYDPSDDRDFMLKQRIDAAIRSQK